MRRVVILIAMLALAAGLSAGPAGAVARTDLPVSGSYTGTWHLEACGEFTELTLRGNGNIAPFGPSSFVLVHCATGANDSFVFTAPDGTVTGDITVAGFSIIRQLFRAHFEIAITGGTGRYAKATGDLISDFEQFAYDSAVATMTGAIELVPPTPTKVSDCKHGGYKNFADAHGRPFRSQLRCVAFVIAQRQGRR
jgi:hypothetical protein